MLPAGHPSHDQFVADYGEDHTSPDLDPLGTIPDWVVGLVWFLSTVAFFALVINARSL